MNWHFCLNLWDKDSSEGYVTTSDRPPASRICFSKANVKRAKGDCGFKDRELMHLFVSLYMHAKLYLYKSLKLRQSLVNWKLQANKTTTNIELTFGSLRDKQMTRKCLINWYLIANLLSGVIFKQNIAYVYFTRVPTYLSNVYSKLP